jgi:ATPase family AAA domain-containing protein 3A/B
LGAPTLAQETSIISFSDRVKGFLFGREQFESSIKDVVLEPKLASRIEELTYSIANTVKNNSYFRHVLLYGPPGTGKTMLAMRIARSVGLEYIYFAASSLDQYSLEEALIKLKDLLEYAKNSSKPIMIIIDESEILFAKRDKGLSEKTQKMLNLILTYTGTETNKFVIFGLTNRPNDIDSAFLSRCDEQIEIGRPGKEQVRQILKMYVDKLLVKPAQAVVPKLSFFSRLMGKRPQSSLKIAKDVFSNTTLDKIATDLYDNQFVGRDIAKTVIAIQHAAYATKDATITKEIVDRVLDIKIQQKQTELKKFKSIA